MAVVYLLDLQTGLTGGPVGYSRWVPSAMGTGDATRAKVAELRQQLQIPPGAEWTGPIDSHPGFPLVQVQYRPIGPDSSLAEMTVGGEWGAILLLARGDDPQAISDFQTLLTQHNIPGAQTLPQILSSRPDRPLLVRGNWIHGSANEAAIELTQLWLATAFFESRGVLNA